jgi:hypothetical protein
MRLKRIIGATVMGAFGFGAVFGLTACEMTQEGVVIQKRLEDAHDREWSEGQPKPPGAGNPVEFSLILDQDDQYIEVNVPEDVWKDVRLDSYFQGKAEID